ncbi:uncharacterized protein LOC106877846 isoform X1 [Octopus bimaculoides]|uniref:uncharacterized protein LOC106877846 isoform X1 n=2 Tax=Octopus bimaculoides TaxID=37653 RepID=UPI0022E4546D|nr:uncharacterized protein LOC106877846 isoform X1 [Octopus bimaculoides]
MAAIVILLNAFWIYSSLAESDTSRCPEPVINTRHYLATFRDSCYVFINQEKYWTKARDYCWWLGGELVHIHDMETMEFLKSVLNSKELGWNRNGVWTGANDLLHEGKWVWTTGEEVTWTYWAPKEPKGITDFFEDCVVMRRKQNWRWHDYHCDMVLYHYNFICQFPLKDKGWKEASPQSAPDGNNSAIGGNMVGLIVGFVVAFIIIMIIFIVYYKRWLKRKYQEPAVLFQNTFYAQMKNDSETVPAVPITEAVANNTYWNTNDMNVLYEEVSKPTNHGVNDMENALSNNINKTCTAEAGAVASGYDSKLDKDANKHHTVKVMNNEIHVESEQNVINENLYEDMAALKK